MRGGKFFESKTATIDSKPVDSLSNRTRRSVANATIILARVAFDPGLEPMGQNEGNGFVEPQPDYFGRTTLGDDLSHPRRSHATRYGEHINNNFTVSSMEIQIRSFLFGGRHVLEVRHQRGRGNFSSKMRRQSLERRRAAKQATRTTGTDTNSLYRFSEAG